MMALKVEINDDPDVPSSWTDITGMVALWAGMQVGGNAHQGEIGTGSGFDLDDDAGDVTLPVKRVVRVRDTKPSPDAVLVRGRVADKTVARGAIPAGNARAYDVQLDDRNADLRGIPIRKWVRPEESDYRRVIALWRRYLKGSPRETTRLHIKYRSGPAEGLGSVRNANRVTLPKQVYRDTDPFGVWRDIAEAAGKEFFVTTDGEMFHDLPTSTRYAASLSITDVVPNLTDEFPPVYGVSGGQDGSEFLSGAILTYGKHRRVSKVRSSVEAAHDFWREVIPQDATGQNDAKQRLKTILSRQAREDRTYTVALELTDDQVGLIKYGQTVSFRSAAAGVLSPVVLRVGRLLWEPTAPRRYRAHLELGFPKKLSPRVRRSRGTNPGNRTASQGEEVIPVDSAGWLLIDGFGRTVGPFQGDTFVYPDDADFGQIEAGPWWEPKTWIVNGNGGSSGETFGIDGDEIWVEADEAPAHFHVIANLAAEDAIQSPVDALETAETPYAITGRFRCNRTVGSLGGDEEHLGGNRWIQFDTGVDQVWVYFTDSTNGPYLYLYAQNAGDDTFILPEPLEGDVYYRWLFTKTADFYGFRVWKESEGAPYGTWDPDPTHWQCYVAGPAYWNGAGPTLQLLELSADVDPGNGWSPFRVAVTSLKIAQPATITAEAGHVFGLTEATLV